MLTQRFSEAALRAHETPLTMGTHEKSRSDHVGWGSFVKKGMSTCSMRTRRCLSLAPFRSANFQGILEEQFGPFGHDGRGVEFLQFSSESPKAIFQFRNSLRHLRSRQMSFDHPVDIEFARDLVYLLGDSGLIDVRS